MSYPLGATDGVGHDRGRLNGPFTRPALTSCTIELVLEDSVSRSRWAKTGTCAIHPALEAWWKSGSRRASHSSVISAMSSTK